MPDSHGDSADGLPRETILVAASTVITSVVVYVTCLYLRNKIRRSPTQEPPISDCVPADFPPTYSDAQVNSLPAQQGGFFTGVNNKSFATESINSSSTSLPTYEDAVNMGTVEHVPNARVTFNLGDEWQTERFDAPGLSDLQQQPQNHTSLPNNRCIGQQINRTPASQSIVTTVTIPVEEIETTGGAVSVIDSGQENREIEVVHL